MVINSPCLTEKKELAIPGQTTTDKEFSNPLMAGSLPKTISAKFWNTATSKTVNSVKQIHVIVDGKAVVIKESLLRNDLLFDDEDEGHHLESAVEGRMEHTFELMDIVKTYTHDSPFGGKVLDSEKEKDAQVGNLKTKERVKQIRIQTEEWLLFKTKDAENQGKIDADDIEAVNTASEGVSTAAPRTPPTTTSVFDDEDVTMAMDQTLIKMKEEKAKEKGVDIKDIEDSSRPIRSITTLQSLPTIDPKDKGKGILQETEPVEKTKKKVQGDAQIERDDEIALRLQVELDEELRVERERQKEASEVAIAEMFNEVQARIDVDYELATRMTQEEQEKYTIEERARNKPPTKTQLRNLMMTYLKNMGGYKHNQLKEKSYEEIQGLYERQQKRIQDFTLIDSEKEAQKLSKRLKRVVGSYATQKSPKKPKVMKSAKDVTEEEAAEYEKEKEELRISLNIISNDDSKVNYEPLSRKFPIVNWEYQLLGKMEEKDMYVYKLTRVDGSSSYHGDTQAFLRRLDRQDLNDLYSGNCMYGYGVHTLFMDGKPMEINMLVENKYPLIKELLEKMLNLQLEAEGEITMAFELIKFIKSLLEE
ncbi:hypothetical protein Tco_0296698 [Tanacetum coccineum]